MALPHNEWIRHSLVALYVGFYILFKLFFSFSTKPSRLCLYLYYTFPNSISHHSQVLSPAFYVLFFVHYHPFFSEQIRFFSLSIYLSISITLLNFHHPHHLLLEHFLSSSRLSSRISLSSTLSLRESLVILQAECYWRPSKAKAKWICQYHISDYITLLLA